MPVKNQPKNQDGTGRKPLIHINLDPQVKSALEERTAELGISKAWYISHLIAQDRGIPGHELPDTSKEAT